MTNVITQNILVGYGDLYYTSNVTDGQYPANDIDPEDLKTNGIRQTFNALVEESAPTWFYAGATQEGVELAYSPEYGEVMVDQLGDAAVMFFESGTHTLNTTLAEATLFNLLLAWGAEDSVLDDGETSTFSIGVAPQDPVERSIAVIGKGSGYNDGVAWKRRDRVYLGRRVLSIEGSSLSMQRSENTAYPVALRLLPDPSEPGAEYGVVLDIVPPEPNGGE